LPAFATTFAELMPARDRGGQQQLLAIAEIDANPRPFLILNGARAFGKLILGI
jgi:hypothetical protein